MKSKYLLKYSKSTKDNKNNKLNIMILYNILILINRWK